MQFSCCLRESEKCASEFQVHDVQTDQAVPGMAKCTRHRTDDFETERSPQRDGVRIGCNHSIELHGQEAGVARIGDLVEWRERLRVVDRAAEDPRVGDPLEPGTLMGPLIDQAAVDNMMKALERVKSEGGKILYGGNRIDRLIAEVEAMPGVLAVLLPALLLAALILVSAGWKPALMFFLLMVPIGGLIAVLTAWVALDVQVAWRPRSARTRSSSGPRSATPRS